MLKTIFIGGKEIGNKCLTELLSKKVKPELVIGNMDDDGKDNLFHKSLIKLAKKKKIKFFKKKNIKRLIKILINKKIDIIFCIGATQIVPKEILKIPKLGCLNIHPSLLPRYRGRYSTVYSIFNGDKFTGVSAHWIGSELDSGKLIYKKKFNINKNDTAKNVYDKFTKIGFFLFKKILNEIIKGKKIKSKKIKATNTMYRNKKLPNDGEIDWKWPGKKIKNFIRATTFEPFDPPFFYLGKEKFIIINSKTIKFKSKMKSPL